MTIQKAIEILSYSSEHNTILITRADKDALKLGIEALKLLKVDRRNRLPFRAVLLPGETED